MDLKENKVFKNWLSSGEDEKTLSTLWRLTKQHQPDYQPDLEKGLASFKNKMAQQNAAVGKTLHLKPVFKFWKIAAAIVVLLGAAYLLRDAIFQDTPARILATADGMLKTLSLEDGSKATLNRSSRLIYPQQFEAARRELNLEGEAFFEIKKDETRPFLVKTALGEIEVLGTSFNVRAYPEQMSLEVYVATGKVRVSIPALKKDFELLPKDYLVYDAKAEEASKTREDTYIPLLWKENAAYFKNQTFAEIFRGMELMYHVEFEVEDQRLLKCKYTLTAESGKLQEALESIQMGCQVNIQKTTAGKYVVSGKCCD